MGITWGDRREQIDRGSDTRDLVFTHAVNLEAAKLEALEEQRCTLIGSASVHRSMHGHGSERLVIAVAQPEGKMCELHLAITMISQKESMGEIHSRP